METNNKNGNNGSTRYISSHNLNRTDDNRLRKTKREDPMTKQQNQGTSKPEAALGTEDNSDTGEEGPSCAI